MQMVMVTTMMMMTLMTLMTKTKEKRRKGKRNHYKEYLSSFPRRHDTGTLKQVTRPYHLIHGTVPNTCTRDKGALKKTTSLDYVIQGTILQTCTNDIVQLRQARHLDHVIQGTILTLTTISFCSSSMAFNKGRVVRAKNDNFFWIAATLSSMRSSPPEPRRTSRS